MSTELAQEGQGLNLSGGVRIAYTVCSHDVPHVPDGLPRLAFRPPALDRLADMTNATGQRARAHAALEGIVSPFPALSLTLTLLFFVNSLGPSWAFSLSRLVQSLLHASPPKLVLFHC